MSKLENEELKKNLNPEDSELKELVVNYIGNKLQPEDDEVNLEMAIEVFMNEFPEFVLALAEENFIRGYQQAFADMEKENVKQV
jgi:hypothetical protein